MRVPVPAKAFQALDAALAQYPGHKLFTILAVDWTRNLSQRVYTNLPHAYPCGGTKPLNRDSIFFRDVLGPGRVRICRNADDIRTAFFDFALIESLGCQSAVNVPIFSGGKPIGSMNLLHENGWYTDSMTPALTQFSALAATPLHQLLSQQG